MVEGYDSIPEDIRKKIESSSTQCIKIVDGFLDQLNAKPTPAILYHYTDSAGLLGILTTGKIRLTNIFGLNDPSELRHGLNHASQILIEESQGGHQVDMGFAEFFKKAIDKNIEKLALYLVACFSCDGDDLGQWRAYGNDGKGFTIN